MCGISGILVLDGGDRDRSAAVERMCRCMVHRGPDDGGVQHLCPVTLGMRRLSIIDLSRDAHQPMSNEDGSVWIVFNGEVYNFAEERRWLLRKGHEFRSRTDAEVLIHLYEEFGPEFIHRLRGMFAFAVWDTRKRRLLLVRDRLGIKPLYYAVRDGELRFASELKGLLCAELTPRALNLDALGQYLALGYVQSPNTLLAGVRALPPATVIDVTDGRVHEYTYWQPPLEGTTQCSREEVLPEVRRLLEESVRIQQVSDVPLGAFLSGGVDSAAVVALMSRSIDRPVRTFSVGFINSPTRFDELGLAAQTAAAFATEHTEVLLRADEVADELPALIGAIDQPSVDGVNTYFVSRAARRGGLTVALSGLGGDEIFGGYGTFRFVPRWAKWAHRWGSFPAWARSPVAASLERLACVFSHSDRWRKLGRLADVDSPLDLYALARLLLWPAQRRALLSADLLGSVKSPTAEELFGGYQRAGESEWQTISRLELRDFMCDRLLRDTDAMSMAHSLEVRVPLIDHKLVEFVMGLPAIWKVARGRPKPLLTRAIADLLPTGILDRPKHGFEFPLGYWMRNVLRSAVEDALAPQTVARRGLFDPGAIDALYQRFRNGKEAYPVVWQLVVLELWMRKFLDAPAVMGADTAHREQVRCAS